MNICRSLSLIFLFCIACDKPLPTLEGIDKGRWEEDKFACKGLRGAMRESLDSQKEKLLTLDQLQIVALLGRPDQNELSKRNQKFFYYYIEPAPSCPNTTDTLAARLAIRFNAMGLAKEVAIVNR